MATKQLYRRRHNGGGTEPTTSWQRPDPTENVKALSEALSDRQDDLRELNNKYLDARLTHVEQMASLRAEHDKQMRESEAKRLDAIRATDVAAVSTTAAQSLAQIQTLATTAQVTAETLRTQQATAATTIANQTDRVVSPIQERLTAIERTINISQGRSALSDPAMAELVVEMRKLTAGSSESQGKQAGISLSAAVIMGIVTAISAAAGIMGWIYALVKP